MASPRSVSPESVSGSLLVESQDEAEFSPSEPRNMTKQYFDKMKLRGSAPFQVIKAGGCQYYVTQIQERQPGKRVEPEVLVGIVQYISLMEASEKQNPASPAFVQPPGPAPAMAQNNSPVKEKMNAEDGPCSQPLESALAIIQNNSPVKEKMSSDDNPCSSWFCCFFSTTVAPESQKFSPDDRAVRRYGVQG